MSFIKKLAKGAQKAMGSVGDTVDKGTYRQCFGSVSAYTECGSGTLRKGTIFAIC
jgi:hypothetical protein